jgi:preprotein translocase subunit SecG
MERKALRQGLWIIVLGVFFLVLTFVLHDLGYVKSDRLIIYYGPSAVLVVLGVVVLVLSQRTPWGISVKKQRQKA